MSGVQAMRSEWVKCISSPATGKSICGQNDSPFEWRFQGLDHAYRNVVEGGNILGCPACISIAASAIGGTGP